MNILGISAFYHDSAAALLKSGEIIAAAQEERFTRKKFDESFPVNAVAYCLKEARLSWNDISAVVFYDKPWLKFERILETYYALAPHGAASFRAGLPVWIKEKALLPRMVRTHVPGNVPLKFSSHHLSHAASAFYPSPFSGAAILTMDGVGEWSTCSIAHGTERTLKIIREMSFPHSVGLLYSAFTQYCGFKVNSGEYKLMGLAPYGVDGGESVERYKRLIKTHLVHIYEDGGIWLDQQYFSYATGLEMVNRESWQKLFGIPLRSADDPLSQPYCDLALAIQQVTEEIVVKLASTARAITGERQLCLAGGVALNCVANSVLRRSKIFDDIWIQPAAGDAGGALGAALAYHYAHEQHSRRVDSHDSMKGAFLGPAHSSAEIKAELDSHGVSFSTPSQIAKASAELIADGQVLGWFQGRMEFGPRALGSRSILADPRSAEMQKKLNLKIKFRESFRPFAPSVLAEDAAEFFQDGHTSPYMLLIDHLKDELRHPLPSDYAQRSLEERLYFVRSQLPAITHLDFSARLQTVHQHTNPLYHELISEFKKLTGQGMVVNTSFNVRGEPIVESPHDALACFFTTEMDALALGPFLIQKSQQTSAVRERFLSRKQEFALD